MSQRTQTKRTRVPAPAGLNWESSDFIEVVVQSALCLRKAMSYADDGCEVKKWVDAKLLEALWCPCGHPDKAERNRTWFPKDILRDELRSLTPDTLWQDGCGWKYVKGDCPRCYAGGLLARVLLGPMDWLFECERREFGKRKSSPLLWVVAKLYDQLGGVNFYRTLSGLSRDERDYRIGQLLFRIPEADYQWFAGRIADFSTLLREAEGKEEVDYCLVCTEKHWKAAETWEFPQDFKKYNVANIMSALDPRARSVRRVLGHIWTLQISDELSRRILSEQTRLHLVEALKRKQEGDQDVPARLEDVQRAFDRHEVESAIDKVREALESSFLSEGNSNQHQRDDDRLIRDIQKLVARVADESGIDLGHVKPTKLANYFIWLKALHPKLGSYTVRYAANYRLLPGSDTGTERERDRIQNACLVIASCELPSSQILAAARLSLTHCLGPLEDYYAIRSAEEWAAAQEREKAEASVQRRYRGFAIGMFHQQGQLLEAAKGRMAEVTRAADAIVGSRPGQERPLINAIRALQERHEWLSTLRTMSYAYLRGQPSPVSGDRSAKPLREVLAAAWRLVVDQILNPAPNYNRDRDTAIALLAHGKDDQLQSQTSVAQAKLAAEIESGDTSGLAGLIGIELDSELAGFSDFPVDEPVYLFILQEILANAVRRTAEAYRAVNFGYRPSIRLDVDSSLSTAPYIVIRNEVSRHTAETYSSEQEIQEPEEDSQTGWGRWGIKCFLELQGHKFKQWPCEQWTDQTGRTRYYWVDRIPLLSGAPAKLETKA